jgi:hypothetical protein
MLQTLQWPTLAERRARIKATMMYSIENDLVAIPPTRGIWSIPLLLICVHVYRDLWQMAYVCW